jgi:hypothetical protein
VGLVWAFQTSIGSEVGRQYSGAARAIQDPQRRASVELDGGPRRLTCAYA